MFEHAEVLFIHNFLQRLNSVQLVGSKYDTQHIFLSTFLSVGAGVMSQWIFKDEDGFLGNC